MTQLIDSSDPRFFTETAPGDYDRHKYKVHLATKVVTCEWYDEAKALWLENPFAQYIEVIDRKKKRR